MQPPAGHIFISYSRRDDETMRRIAFFLRDQGFKVWVDNEKLIPGTAAWEESIETAIKNAYAMVIVLSPDSKSSEWVRREITYADQFEKRIFPVLVRGSGEESVPLRLVTRQYVDMRKGEEAGLNALAASIRFFIENRQTLEMKRPPGMPKPAPSTPVAGSRAPIQKPSRAWILAAGGVLAVCLLGAGILWVGSRLVQPMPASEPPQPFSATATTPVPQSTDADPVPPSSAETASLPAPGEAPGIPSNYLNDVEVVRVDSFDDPQAGGWDLQIGQVEGGVLEIPGNENYDGAFRLREFSAGEGAMIDFQFEPGSVFEIFLDRGEYSSEDYARIGAYIEGGQAFVNGRAQGTNIEGTFTGSLTLEADTTYSYLIAVLDDGEFLQVIWDSSNPSQTLSFRDRFDPSWSRLGLTFFVQAGAGQIRFDNFREIGFGGAK